MTYDEALKYFGGTQSALGAALGLAQPTVSCWGKVVPRRYQFELQVLTNGDLKVDDELLHNIAA